MCCPVSARLISGLLFLILTAGDIFSADDGGGGETLALDNLRPDSRSARRTGGALLLAEGGKNLLIFTDMNPSHSSYLTRLFIISRNQ